MNFQVVLRQATQAGTSKADVRARTTADTAAAENPVPGRAGSAESGGRLRPARSAGQAARGRFEKGRAGEHGPEDGRPEGEGPDRDLFAEARPDQDRPAN